MTDDELFKDCYLTVIGTYHNEFQIDEALLKSISVKAHMIYEHLKSEIKLLNEKDVLF